MKPGGVCDKCGKRHEVLVGYELHSKRGFSGPWITTKIQVCNKCFEALDKIESMLGQIAHDKRVRVAISRS